MSDYNGSTGPINQAITHYQTLERIRFHVPGHSGVYPFNLTKQSPSASIAEPFYKADLTELEGMDVLSEPAGCIAESQALIATLYDVKASFYLLNGATIGLQAAMLSCFKPGDAVLLPRNVHRSVVAGLILVGLQPVWFLPKCYPDFGLWGAVTPKHLEQTFNQQFESIQNKIAGVILTSPTYEGIGSDINAISQFCKSKNLKLIIDEAHGSLWPLSNLLPNSACQAKADVVIQSTHKGVGSVTQTAIAHLPKQSTIVPEVFQQALNTLHTTSPSYPLLANLEASILFGFSEEGQKKLKNNVEQSKQLREAIESELTQFKIFKLNSESWDTSQLFIQNQYFSAEEWAVIVEEDYGVSFESMQPYGALYKVGLGLSKNNFDRLFSALQRWEHKNPTKEIQSAYTFPEINGHYLPLNPNVAMSPRDAFFAAGEIINKTKAIGRIAKETIVHCPPGIPVLYPGEVIDKLVFDYLPEQIMVIQN